MLTAADPLAAAAALAPRLAERAPEAERLGRLPDDVIALVEEAGLLRQLAPRHRGGHQVDLATFVRVQEELAAGCGSTSWVVGIYAAAVYMTCSFPDRAQDEVFASAVHPKILAAFQVSGMATPVAGGYRLTGTWRFCSGQHHADWALLSSVAVGADGIPMPAQFLVPRSDCVSAEDWQVIGLSGTGSCTLTVADVVVPAHRVLPLAAPNQPQSRSDSLAGEPYFGMPFVPLFVTGGIGTPLGLARAAVEAFGRRVQERGISYTPYERQADAAVTHLAMDTATMKLDQARFHADRAVATVAAIAADPGNVGLRVRCRADAAWATKLCAESIQTVRAGCGAGVIRRDDPVSRIHADIQALSVHSFLLHSTNAELHGRVLCGLEPGVPYL